MKLGVIVAKIKTTLYVHSSKESMWEKGEELGLSDVALRNFCYALYEVSIPVIIDTETGNYEIVKEEVTG
jgi:hypothetical protein